MPKYTITHQNGRQEVDIEARHILDMMFSYRGNFKSIIKVEEQPEFAPIVPTNNQQNVSPPDQSKGWFR